MLLSFIAPVLFAAVHSGLEAETPRLRPAYAGETLVLREAAGHWSLLGYGHVLTLEDGGPRVRSFTRSLGWEVGLLDADEILLGPEQSNGRRLFATGPLETPFTLERVAEPPARCLAPTEWTRERVFQAFEETLSDYYPFFEVRGFDWNARAAAARARVAGVTTDAELAELIAGTLEGLGDGHVSFVAEVEGEEIELEPGDSRLERRIRSELDPGLSEAQREVAFERTFEGVFAATRRWIREGLLGGRGVWSEPFLWGRVDEDIGYVQITDMVLESGSLEEMVEVVHRHLEEVLEQLEGVQVMVLDVSLNGGGADAVSHAIAAHFADEPRHAYSKGPAARPDVRRDIVIEPWPGRRFTGPVFVVSSEWTASAAEIFQLCCRVFPHVELVGTPGEAIFSDIVPRPLPNGWELTISAETYTTPEGVCYEGLGVPVDIELPIFDGEDLTTSHRDALLALFDLIRP